MERLLFIIWLWLFLWFADKYIYCSMRRSLINMDITKVLCEYSEKSDCLKLSLCSPFSYFSSMH